MEKELMNVVKELNQTVSDININLMKQYESQIDSEITSKQAALLEIIKEHDVVSVSMLAQKMKVTSSAVSQIVSKLEGMQYVFREINPNNRREIRIGLDKKGKQYFKMKNEVDAMIIKKYYSRIDLEDLRHIRDTFNELKQIIDHDLEDSN